MTDSDNSAPPTQLSANTVFTFKTAGMLALIGAVFYAGGEFQAMKQEMRSLKMLAQDQWTYEMAKEAWSEYQRNNPDSKVPELYRIRESNRPRIENFRGSFSAGGILTPAEINRMLKEISDNE